MCPRRDEVVDELLLRVRSCRRPPRSPAAARSSRTADRRACRSIRAHRCRHRGLRTAPWHPTSAFHAVRMSSRLTKKSLVSASGRCVKTPCFDPSTLVLSTRMPPTSTVISGAVSVSSCARSMQQRLGRHLVAGLLEVAEAVGHRFEDGERLDIGLLLRRVHASGRERHRHRLAAVLRGLLDAGATAQHDQIRERHFLAALLRAVERLLKALQRLQHLRQLRRLVDRPVLLRRQPDAGAVGAAALVGAAEGGRRRPRGRDQLRHRQP